jgi:hypothetical protein
METLTSVIPVPVAVMVEADTGDCHSDMVVVEVDKNNGKNVVAAVAEAVGVDNNDCLDNSDCHDSTVAAMDALVVCNAESESDDNMVVCMVESRHRNFVDNYDYTVVQELS